jgi:hypothetical protein
MSALTSVASRFDRDDTVGAGRRRLLFAVLLTTAVISFKLAVLAYLRPIGEGGDLPRYADIEPNRDLLWSSS